ncbi:rRNA pseudouridine synthase [Candidatus Profftella armatura (Diaphorina cf. continua)]|uniref:Pseudouridine synthase n=1 Tax=Candidatus Profftella armatura (Diaphorina cf. continua) TaxID=2661583 RepID=A0A7R7ACA3_9PROT|nr:pseudouridine synthase [Candidatus Profftella armatura (Diaphorina cf. continua)]BCG49620.1 rRNA pseudouridine synthase [Candidatus Profftella armatura (Diaphorina cf. continua)]
MIFPYIKNISKNIKTPKENNNFPKLQKALANIGIGSRRNIEKLIISGCISINNKLAHIGQRISLNDCIKINGKLLKNKIYKNTIRILIYYKPSGEIVSYNDPNNRPSVFDNLPNIKYSKWLSIGRLDFNTEGLLLFTNSGKLVNRLSHPRYNIEREYAVRILGKLTNNIKIKLIKGIKLKHGLARFSNISESGGYGSNKWYKVIIYEGRNREVRKMFEIFGLVVSRLIRIRYGIIKLPYEFKRGYLKELKKNIVNNLLLTYNLN